MDRLHILRSFVVEAQKRIVVVTAPAGYGKSVLISQHHQWLAGRGDAVGWVSLDRTDNDPVTLLSYLIAAIGSGVSARGEPLDLPAPAELGADVQGSLNALLAALAAFGRDFHLFLDDVDSCADEATVRLLAAFISRAPDNLHLILASRAPPQLALGRLKARGAVGMIDWSDLLFQREEAGALLEALGGPAPTEEQLDRMIAATEGWAMGLHLAGLALRHRDGVTDVIANFSGRFDSVAEYLAEDVLEFKDPATTDFLMRTAAFGRFSADLCNESLGIANAAQIIESLDRSNTFLFSIDREKTWFRYHNLFQDFLRKRLRDRLPGEMDRLQRAASRWFGANGHYHDALDMAQATHDVEFLAASLNSVCDGLFQAGQLHLLRKVVTRLPLDLVAKFPRLALCAVWADNMLGHLHQAQHLLSIVEDAYGADPSLAAHYPSRVRLDDAILHRRMMSALSTGEMSTVDALCDMLLATASFCDPYLVASVHAAQIFARHHLFDCRGITGRAEQIIDFFPEGGLRNGSLWTNCIVGLAHERRGEIGAARLVYSRALDSAGSTRQPVPLAGMPATLLAQVCYEQDEIETARALLDAHAVEAPVAGLIDQFSSGPITRSRLAVLSGDRETAARLLDEAIDFFAGRGLDRVRMTLVAERVRQATSDGRPEEAALIAGENGVSLDERPPPPAPGMSTWNLIDAVTWCRIAVNSGEYHAAGAVLRGWIDYCRARNCEKPATQMTLQLAQIRMLAGDLSSALKLTKASISAGFKMGLRRSFVDEGGSMHTLLSAIYDEPASLADDQRRYVRGLLERFAEHRQRGGRGDAQGIANLVVTPLTRREIEILNLVGKGIKGCFIAAQLDITEGTVKWYMQQIFDKLDVRNRSEAVERARELGFVP